ncbi:hypothetical protein [Streptomyces thermolineatus]
MTPLYDGPPTAAPGRAAPGRHRTPGTGAGRALAARATGGEER